MPEHEMYPFAGDVANDIREVERLLRRGKGRQAGKKAAELRKKYERRGWGETKEEYDARVSEND